MHAADISPGPSHPPPAAPDWTSLAAAIKTWGRQLGFQQVGIADTDLATAEARLEAWLDAGYQGEMHYMARHGRKRSRPDWLIPGTRRVIVARMDYLPETPRQIEAQLQSASADPAGAFLSRYALGRDYHKVLRQRLQALAKRIAAVAESAALRVFVDSAPVLEKPLAQKAGLGWIGKHTNLLHPRAGSWFFLGAIYTDLPLPPDAPATDHCGRCRACLDICPTQAIVAPYQLDARRCIAYLTIEHSGSIPLPLRSLLGNRIHGCDDCQWICPWNRFARLSAEPDFAARHGLERATLIELFGWNADEFLARTQGSAIRRIGHERWLRNLAVGLGNAAPSQGAARALRARADHPSPLVREHIAWALEHQQRGLGNN